MSLGTFLEAMTRSDGSSGAAVIVAQQTADSFAAIEDALRASDFLSRFDQLVVESLMIAFVVVDLVKNPISFLTVRAWL